METFNFTEKTTPTTSDFLVGYDAALGAVSGAERKVAVGNLPVSTATQTALDAKSPIASPTFTGTATTPALNISGQTVSTIAVFDASKNLISAALGTYPSLTELAYVKGLTSAAQTQINSKISNASSFRDCQVLVPSSSGVISPVDFWRVSEVFKTFDGAIADSKFASYDSTDGWYFRVSTGNGVLYSQNLDGGRNKYSTGNLRVGTLNTASTAAGILIGGQDNNGEIGTVGTGTSVIFRAKLHLKKVSDATNTYVFRTGLISFCQTSQPGSGIWLEYDKDVNSGNWVLYSKNSGSVSSANLSAGPRFNDGFNSDYYQEIEIYFTSSSAVARVRDFGDSGPGTWSSDVSISTNLPLTGGYGTSHGVGGAVIVSTASTTGKEFYIDYLFYRRVQE